MWLFTKVGFFSAVAKKSNPLEIKIRSRVREDLVALREKYFPIEFRDAEIVDTPNRDYPYRVFVPVNAFGTIMQATALDVDYTNFKSKVGESQGYVRAQLYSDVWGIMYGAESKLKPRQPRREVCTDPDKMHGAGDGLGGSDY